MPEANKEQLESARQDDVSSILDMVLDQDLGNTQGISKAFNVIMKSFDDLSRKLTKEGKNVEDNFALKDAESAISLFWRDFSFISNMNHLFNKYSDDDMKELKGRFSMSATDSGMTGLAPSVFLSKSSHFTAAKVLVNSNEAGLLKDVIKEMIWKCLMDSAEEFRRKITQIKQKTIGAKEGNSNATELGESGNTSKEGLNMDEFMENGQVNISKLMQSEQFIKAIRKFDEKIRSKMIGLAVEYLILHPDGFALPEMLASMLENNDDNYEMSMNFEKTVYLSILKKLKISSGEAETSANRKRIYDYYVKNYMENGAVFHAFNGAYEKNIREEGLSPERRIWDYEEIDEVNRILTKAGDSMAFGWLNINSKKGVFFDEGAGNMYRYACASPEWFAQFVSEGFHVKNTTAGKTAYYRRDYAQSKENVQKYLESKGNKLTVEEKIKVLNLFEKFWKMLAHEGSHPKVALISRKVVGLDKEIPLEVWEDICQRHRKTALSSEELFRAVISSGSNGIDRKTDKSIPPEQIRIVDLPDYKRVFGEETGKRANKSEKHEATHYDPGVVESMLKGENYDVKKLIDEFKKDPDLKSHFEADAGVSERYTIEKHTEMATGQFERYFGDQPLPAGIGRDFMRLTMAIHDIGKPVALGKKQKTLEHDETVKIIRVILKKLARPETDERLMSALLSDDPVGKFLAGKIGLDEVTERIKSMSKRSGVDISSFFELLLVFYMCDAGSYTQDAGGRPSLDYLFEFDRKNGKMTFAEIAASDIDRIRKRITD